MLGAWRLERRREEPGGTTPSGGKLQNAGNKWFLVQLSMQMTL